MEPRDKGVVWVREGCAMERDVITLYVTEEKKRVRDLALNTGVTLHCLALKKELKTGPTFPKMHRRDLECFRKM